MKHFFTKYFTKHNSAAILYSIAVLTVLVFSHCAQIVPLTGGDKDVIPPKPLKMIPTMGETKVHTKTMMIEFDEYIQTQDVQNQLIVTPQLKELPEISVKGKILQIKFQDELSANTTYCMNFGNSIVDLHESNKLRDFKYVFSTGDNIDSLKLSGKLTDAFSQLPIKDAWVMLYESTNDSVVYKDKAAYIGRSNEGGTYNIPYIKGGKYKVFALKDNNKNFLYDADEQIGFYKDPTTDITKNDTIDLIMFKEDPSKVYLKKVNQPYYGKAELLFNAPLEDNVELTLKNGKGNFDENKYKAVIRNNRDTITIYYNNTYGDTLTTIVSHGATADTNRLIIVAQEEVQRLKDKQRLPFELYPSFNVSQPVPYFKELSFRTNRMFKKFDFSKTYLMEEADTIKGDKIEYRFSSADSFYVGNRLKPNKNYKLVVGAGTFTDYLEVENDTAIYKFKTQAADYYATLIVNLALKAQQNWVLQAYSSKGRLVREIPFDSKTDKQETTIIKKIKLDKLDPDTYFLKLIVDSDKNKRYSTGNYNTKTYPEKVISYTQELKLVGDWEMEIDWKIEN